MDSNSHWIKDKCLRAMGTQKRDREVQKPCKMELFKESDSFKINKNLLPKILACTQNEASLLVRHCRY